MISFSEVRQFFNNFPYSKINEVYESDEDYGIRQDNLILKKILEELGLDYLADTFPFDNDYTINMIYLIMNLYLNDQEQMMKIYAALLKYKFDAAQELLMAMHLVDCIYSKKTRLKNANQQLIGCVAIDKIKIKGDHAFLDTLYGKVYLRHLDYPLSISARAHNCHHLTSEVLKSVPEFTGVVYAVPNYFTGSFLHSVPVNSHNIALDFTKNCAIAESVFNSWFGTPIFTISGADFSKIHGEVLKEFDQDIKIADLVVMQRILKK